MYIPGDWKMICDRCGIQFHRSEMREEWTGLWVCKKNCWDSRHPQGFIELQPERAFSKPVLPNIEQTMGDTTLTIDVSAWNKYIELLSITGLSDGDPIGVDMDNGATHWSFINGDPISGVILYDSNGKILLDSNGEIVYALGSGTTGTIILGSPVSFLSTTGNAVYLPSINNESWT